MNDIDWHKTPEFLDKEILCRIPESEFRKLYLNEWKNQWTDILFIFAQNYEQARMWAIENNCPKTVWRYISSVESIKGVFDGKVIRLPVQFWNDRLISIINEIEWRIDTGRMRWWSLPLDTE